MPEPHHHPSSYRDPSGFVFLVNGIYHRQVNAGYADNYDHLMQSGLYDTLVTGRLLIPHEEIPENLTASPQWYRTLQPQQLPFISYPYEWGFEQLRDAALHTLAVLKQAVEKNMILKDASPYNIQFVQGRPLFIDTLSFEKYDASLPWIAYRQFCESFLFPLYLEHYCGIASGKTLTAWPDGVPAAVTARLLPGKSRFNAGALLHVHLQAGVKKGSTSGRQPVFSRQKLTHLILHLENILRKLKSGNNIGSTWSNYYNGTILGHGYLQEKQRLFREYIKELPFHSALDLGANDGYFSKILAERTGTTVVAVDGDAACIDRMYKTTGKKDGDLLPLCIDLLHPSPAIGFRNRERTAFHERFRTELVVALALVHHLVLSGNVPLADLPAFLAELSTDALIIEFVPLEDEKAQELIRHKAQWHLPYDAAAFEACFRGSFSIQQKNIIPGTERILYLMKKQRP